MTREAEPWGVGSFAVGARGSRGPVTPPDRKKMTAAYTEADERTDDFLRQKYPEVEAFAKRMRAELWANRDKGDQEGWLAMNVRQAWNEMSWHIGKMTYAIKTGDAALAFELAADIANGAMMFDDILRTALENGDGFD